MGDAVPHTLNNERWVIDRLVEAVQAGDTDAKAKLAQRFLDGVGEDEWCSWRLIEDGHFLSFANLDPRNMQDEDLESLREEEGTEPDRWREVVADRAFAPECAALWVMLAVKHQRSPAVYVAATVARALDWNGRAQMSFLAAYATYTDTLNAVKAQGFTGRKDYQARSADVLANMKAGERGPVTVISS